MGAFDTAKMGAFAPCPHGHNMLCPPLQGMASRAPGRGRNPEVGESGITIVVKRVTVTDGTWGRGEERLGWRK